VREDDDVADRASWRKDPDFAGTGAEDDGLGGCGRWRRRNDGGDRRSRQGDRHLPHTAPRPSAPILLGVVSRLPPERKPLVDPSAGNRPLAQRPPARNACKTQEPTRGLEPPTPSLRASFVAALEGPRWLISAAERVMPGVPADVSGPALLDQTSRAQVPEGTHRDLFVHLPPGYEGLGGAGRQRVAPPAHGESGQPGRRARERYQAALAAFTSPGA
jgi:hypothetical protein